MIRPIALRQRYIHLIDVAAGRLCETLARSSPDGKTLATAGHRKVLLWGLTNPPGGPR